MTYSKLTRQPPNIKSYETREEKLQVTMERSGMKGVRVTEANGSKVNVYCPTYADWVLTRATLRDLGYEAERVYAI